MKTNPLKNVRTLLQLNPYAAVLKKNAELTDNKQKAVKAAAAAKKAGQKLPPNANAKRSAAIAKKGGKKAVPKKITKK